MKPSSPETKQANEEPPNNPQNQPQKPPSPQDLAWMQARFKRMVQWVKKTLRKFFANPKVVAVKQTAEAIFELYRGFKQARLDSKAALFGMALKAYESLVDWVQEPVKNKDSKLSPLDRIKRDWGIINDALKPAEELPEERKEWDFLSLQDWDFACAWANVYDSRMTDLVEESEGEDSSYEEIALRLFPCDVSKDVAKRIMRLSFEERYWVWFLFDQETVWSKVDVLELLETYPRLGELDGPIYRFEYGGLFGYFVFHGDTFDVIGPSELKGWHKHPERLERFRRWLIPDGFCDLDMRVMNGNEVGYSNDGGDVRSRITFHPIIPLGEGYKHTQTTKIIRDECDKLVEEGENFFLLYGRAGSGKSSFIEDVARQRQAFLIDVDLEALAKMKVGSNYEALADALNSFDPKTTIVVMNDVDRSSMSLMDLDNIRQELYDYNIFFTCNNITKMDKAMFRPKRIEYVANLDVKPEEKRDLLCSMLKDEVRKEVSNYLSSKKSAPFMSVITTPDFTTDFIRWTAEHIEQRMEEGQTAQQACESLVPLMAARLEIMLQPDDPMLDLERRQQQAMGKLANALAKGHL